MNTLAGLQIGEKALVRNVQGSDHISIRLMEMGLVPGVEVALLGRALLGDPLELDVRGYRLSVRKSEAARVEIEVLHSPGLESGF